MSSFLSGWHGLTELLQARKGKPEAELLPDLVDFWRAKAAIGRRTPNHYLVTV
jgi:hypothetical protein